MSLPNPMIYAHIGSNTHVDEGVEIGKDSFVWNNCVIRSNVKIGAYTTIGHLVLIERDTVIGDHATIQSQCHITAEAIIGNYVFIGPGVIMTNEKSIASCGRTAPKIEGPIIHRGVRIGAGCLIAPGVEIGENASIAMGSFVRKSIPAGEFWGMIKGKMVKIKDVPEEEWL